MPCPSKSSSRRTALQTTNLRQRPPAPTSSTTTTPLPSTKSPPPPPPPSSSTSSPRHLSMVACLLVSLVLAASGLTPANGFPRNRRHFFTTCWGWGASCSMYGRGSSSSSDAATPGRTMNSFRVRERPSSQTRRTDPFEIGLRTSGRLPSPFTSTNWGAGTMGKRTNSQDMDRTYNQGGSSLLMDALGQAVAMRNLLAASRKTN